MNASDIRLFLLSCLFGSLGWVPYLLDEWFLASNRLCRHAVQTFLFFYFGCLFLIQPGHLPIWLAYGGILGFFISFLTLLSHRFPSQYD